MVFSPHLSIIYVVFSLLGPLLNEVNWVNSEHLANVKINLSISQGYPPICGLGTALRDKDGSDGGAPRRAGTSCDE